MRKCAASAPQSGFTDKGPKAVFTLTQNIFDSETALPRGRSNLCTYGKLMHENKKNLFQDKWWSAAEEVKILKRKMFFKSSGFGTLGNSVSKRVVFCGKFVSTIDKRTNFLEFVSSSGKCLVCPGPDCLRR